MSKNGFTAGSPPRTPLRWLIALPQTHSWTKGDGREKEGERREKREKGRERKRGKGREKKEPGVAPYLQLLDPPVV